MPGARNSLLMHLAAIAGLPVACLFVTTLATVLLLDGSVMDATAVNLAGRQRFLLASMEADAVILSDSSQPPAVRAAAQADLARSESEFSRALVLLRSGGQLDEAATVILPAARGEELLARLDRLDIAWDTIRLDLDHIRVEGDPPGAIERVIARHARAVELAEHVVSAFEVDSIQRIRNVIRVQFALAATNLVALGLGLLVARNSVIQPISRITSAAEHMSTGDLSVAVPTAGLGEITRLGGALERVRLSQLDTIAALSQADRIAELARTNAELARQADAASRAKSDFLTTMSHELRTPINVILGYLDLATRRGGKLLPLVGPRDDGTRLVMEQIQYMGEARSAAHMLLTQINEILDLAKIEASRMELEVTEVEFASVVQELGSALLPLVERNGNRLVLEGCDAVGVIATDVDKLRRCILNLVANAARFTENGQITIRARRIDTPVPDRFEIHVIDNGIGVAPDAMARLFEPFAQGTSGPNSGGTGIGLTIVRALVALLHGEVSVTSQLHVGSDFVLTLPRVIATKPEVV